MTSGTRRFLARKGSRVAAVALMAVAILLGTAAVAAAHANLVTTTPAQSAHYAKGTPPQAVSLVFDDVVTTTPQSIGVYDGAGKPVKSALESSRPARTIAARLPALTDGSYVVVWHIVSDDGHPEQGAFTFVVGAGGASTADIGGLLASRRSGPGIGLALGVDRALGFLGCLVLVGGLAFVRWRWPSALARRDIRLLLLVSAALALLASVLSLPLQAAYSGGGGVSRMFNATALGDVVSARFGRAALVRVGLIVLLAALVFVPARPARRPVRAAAEAGVALAGLGVLATFAYAGHGYTGRWPVTGFALDIAHLGAAAVWLGGLAVLAWALRLRTRQSPTPDAVDRFSRLALPAVAVIVLSGTFQGWRQIASWSGLWHTSYSRLLIIKVLAVMAILVIASAARQAVAGSRTSLQELRKGIWIEAGLAALVLAITSTLVVTPPAREAVAAAKTPTAVTTRLDVHGTRVGYGVAVQPSLPGENTLVVNPHLVTRTGFLPATLTGVVQEAGSATRTPVTFTPLSDGRWVAVAAFPRSGIWNVTLNAETPPMTDAATLRVPIR